MTVDLYYAPQSAPCRAVRLAAKALGVELNLKLLDLLKGDHLLPEYLKISPQHTVPTIVDDGFILSESRAIITYLASKYGKNDSLYPKDLKKRAVVDQRLYFDAATLYARFTEYYFPYYFGGLSLEASKLDKLKDAFATLNTYLGSSKYAAGNNLTVADLSLVASVSTIDVAGFDISKYPNVVKWYANVKVTAPGYEEENGKNLEAFKQMVEFLTKKK